MKSYYKKLFEDAIKYESLSNHEKRIYFYDQTSNILNYNQSVTVYDGDTFHILCKKELYDSCFAHNNDALDELEHKLLIRNSLLLNMKHILLTLFWSVPFILIFLFSFKFVSYGKTFPGAEKILNMYKFIIAFYFFGHLLRIFVAKRYKVSRYKNIFNFITDKQFVRDYTNYKKRAQTFYMSSSNPYNKPLLKNIFRILLFTGFYLFIIMFSLIGISGNSTRIDKSLQNRLTFLNDTFLPSASETRYKLEDTSIVFDHPFDNFYFFGDYIITEYDLTYELVAEVYDMDFNLKFDVSYISNLESYGIRDIVDQYMLIIAKFNYSDDTEIIIYDLEQNDITLQLNSSNFPVSSAKAIRSNDFTIADDKFYLSISYYLDDSPSDEKNEFNGVLEVDQTTQMRLRKAGVYPIQSIEYLNGYLYYIINNYDFYEFYEIGRSPISSFNNDLYEIEIQSSNVHLLNANNLITYDNKLYLNVYNISNELVSFDEDFNFMSIGLGLSRPYFSSIQNIFLFGTDNKTFIEYDAQGKVINQGIICEGCNESLKFYKNSGELFALGTDSNLLYRFYTLQDPEPIYNNSHQLQDVFPSFELDLDTLYLYIIVIMLTISSMSYLILIKSFIDKYKANEFFELNW